MVTSSSYSTLKDAIRNKKRVEAYYKNYFRIFCPVAIGKSKGVPTVLAYQVGGGDASGVVTAGHGLWLCMGVADVVRPVQVAGEWLIMDLGEGVDQCLDDVDLMVDMD